jgi:hypothetical protein
VVLPAITAVSGFVAVFKAVENAKAQKNLRSPDDFFLV